MKRISSVAFILLLFLPGAVSYAQETDSLALGPKGSDRNMMLNAESASAPREINIGLPESGSGAYVYVDGMANCVALLRSQYHWAGGNMFSSNGTIGMCEALITASKIGILVDSRTRLGGDDFSGAVTIGSSTNGLIRFDGVLGGPIKKARGWYYSIGAYVNYDPTNVNAPNRIFVDQKQIYGFSLSKRWEKTTIDAMYRFSLCNDSVDKGYSSAPFVYNGDGTISPYNGFRLGRDCYFTADDAVSYMDIRTGAMKNSSLGRMDHRYIHDFTVLSSHKHHTGWALDARLHIMYMQPSQSTRVALAGIDKATGANGFTKADGSPFNGYMQNRLVNVDDQEEFDTDLRLTAEKRFSSRHKLKLGVQAIYSRQTHYTSTFYYAHTVEADPLRIYKGGHPTWGMNTSGLFYDADVVNVPLYALYDYDPCERLHIRAGARLSPLYQSMWNATITDGETKNTRVNGFNLADENLSQLHYMNLFDMEYAFTGHLNLRLIDRLFLMAEGFYNKAGKTGPFFKGAKMPSGLPVRNAHGRGGLTYDNKWIDLTALVSYIYSWNNAAVMTVTKQIGGISETIPWTAQYCIGTLGFTLDGNLHLGGFNIHLLGTWQDPRYKNYTNEFVFSDGSSEIIGYTDNHVTGISQLMFEIDPSYSWERLKIWASARYYSRQYVSRTNLAYFAGHWETFAGLDWKINESFKVAVNLVNVLFQNGAKGSIDVADTITDSSLLNNYIMSGSYIRPFSADLMLTYKF